MSNQIVIRGVTIRQDALAERPGTIHKEGYNLKWNFEKVKPLLLAEIY